MFLYKDTSNFHFKRDSGPTSFTSCLIQYAPGKCEPVIVLFVGSYPAHTAHS